MIDHLTLKLVHITCAYLSITGFIVRATLMFFRPGILKQRWMRTWPHFIDTILLVSAIWMAINIQQYPFTTDWLTAKVFALLLYIVAATFALRTGKNLQIRLIALAIALASVAYIFAVAHSRTPLPL